MNDKAKSMLKAMPSRKVMYLHGLESIVPDKKTRCLDDTFTLYAPQIDYRKQNIFKEILLSAKKYKPAIIIGSSMGGYFGYYLAGELNIPAILFNPALPYRTNVNPEVSNTNKHPNKVTIILGKNDNVIKSNDSLEWINKHQNNIEDITIRLLNFDHSVPIEIFTNEVDRYYNKQ